MARFLKSRFLIEQFGGLMISVAETRKMHRPKQLEPFPSSFSSMVSLFIMSLPRNLSPRSSPSAPTLAKQGDNQVQAGTEQQHQQATHDSSRCFCFGGPRKFYRAFPPFWGKLPEQSRNGKYIGLLAFPSWEGYYVQ